MTYNKSKITNLMSSTFKTILFSILLLTAAGGANASRQIEDLTTYTEVDVPADRFSTTSTKLTITDADRDEACYEYKDYGSSHFNGNFEHWMTISTTTNALYSGVYWALTNQVSVRNSWTDSLYLGVDSSNTLYLSELVSSENYNDGFSYTNNQILYIVIIRDESIGTFGTLYAYIYSDASHETLLDTLSVSLHSKADFQYIYSAACSGDGVSGRDWDGYIENISLAEAATPTPTPSSISETSTGTSSNPMTFTFTIFGVFSALALVFILLKWSKTI